MRTIRQVESVKRELREVDLRDLNYVDDCSEDVNLLAGLNIYENGEIVMTKDSWFAFNIPNHCDLEQRTAIRGERKTSIICDEFPSTGVISDVQPNQDDTTSDI